VTSSVDEVPRDALSPAALRGLIEEFVTRAGTDYGAHEKTVEEKIADVERQLERGQATIVFDPEMATTNIVSTRPSRSRQP
jgi:uncharacterized protein YheU (UPF0270 family)